MTWDDYGYHGDDEWPEVPTPIPGNPYDEDGYCHYCGNGSWKFHAPWCKWQDAMDVLTQVS